ncbi:MAG: Cof-type HAD-IIB family hydrolase [Aerococcus sp.]|nr:Cof-type HAD-IIB family hydrolase [Aerococcus sp.]
MLELIASDMDGTLITGDLHITEENRQALLRTYALGIPFVACTGRNFREAQFILAEAGIHCPVIGLNGAVLFDRDGTVEHQIALSDEQALALMDYCQKHQLYLEAMTAKNVYSPSRALRIEMMAGMIMMRSDATYAEAIERAKNSNEVKSIAYLDDLSTLITEQHQSILKLSVTDARGPELLTPLAKQFEETFGPLNVTSSIPYNLEISAEEANKGAAIKRYCALHGYHLENVMTIGDNLNDIAMLDVAGYGFAMENALPPVKEAADYVTLSNNDSGVAQAIYQALKLSGTEDAEPLL